MIWLCDQMSISIGKWKFGKNGDHVDKQNNCVYSDGKDGQKIVKTNGCMLQKYQYLFDPIFIQGFRRATKGSTNDPGNHQRLTINYQFLFVFVGQS